MGQGCGSTLKKEAGSEKNSEATKFTELEAEAKNILLLSHPLY